VASACIRVHCRATVALWVLVLVSAAAPAGAMAEQASQPSSPAAGQLDLGKNHTCAVVAGGSVRCWGYGREGELGYPDTISVGAAQTPASVGRSIWVRGVAQWRSAPVRFTPARSSMTAACAAGALGATAVSALATPATSAIRRLRGRPVRWI